mgnify:CR=1 FL=1
MIDFYKSLPNNKEKLVKKLNEDTEIENNEKKFAAYMLKCKTEKWKIN